MLRAHKQAWAWQDEWNGLTMENIREIERQTQLALQQKMGLGDSTEDELGEEAKATAAAAATTAGAAAAAGATGPGVALTPQESDVAKTLAATLGSIEKNDEAQSPPSVRKPSDIPIINTAGSSEAEISPEDSPTDLDEIRYGRVRIIDGESVAVKITFKLYLVYYKACTMY